MDNLLKAMQNKLANVQGYFRKSENEIKNQKTIYDSQNIESGTRRCKSEKTGTTWVKNGETYRVLGSPHYHNHNDKNVLTSKIL